MTSMHPSQLVLIEHDQKKAVRGDLDPTQLLEEDIPKLIAEVRRLQDDREGILDAVENALHFALGDAGQWRTSPETVRKTLEALVESWHQGFQEMLKPLPEKHDKTTLGEWHIDLPSGSVCATLSPHGPIRTPTRDIEMILMEWYGGGQYSTSIPNVRIAEDFRSNALELADRLRPMTPAEILETLLKKINEFAKYREES